MKKSIILIIVNIILFSATAVVVFGAFQATIDYVSILIVDEQNDHYYKMQEHIQRLQKEVADIEEDVEALTSNKLTLTEKKDVYKKLRELESVSLNISKEIGFYQEDSSVHFFFTPEWKITALFDEARNTPVYVDRFVRIMEQGLFEQYVVRSQSRIIQKNFDLLKEELNDFEKIKF